jgi:hypothetical protein
MTGKLSSPEHELDQGDSGKEQAAASVVQEENNDSAGVESASLSEHAWQWATWAGAKTFDGLDFAGEVVADFLGLTRSKYQWILDMQEREREEKRVRRLEARQRRQLRLEQLLEQEKRRLEELELGGASVETDDNQTESEA